MGVGAPSLRCESPVPRDQCPDRVVSRRALPAQACCPPRATRAHPEAAQCAAGSLELIQENETPDLLPGENHFLPRKMRVMEKQCLIFARLSEKFGSRAFFVVLLMP